MRGQSIFGEEGCEIVGGGVKLFGCNATIGGHGVESVLPYTADVGANLFAVGIAHVGAGVDFACTFIGTGCGTDEFHVDTQFIEQTFVEHHFGTHATEIDDSGGVDGYPVGGCGEVVLWLREGFAIGDNGFVAAGTEVLYGFQ